MDTQDVLEESNFEERNELLTVTTEIQVKLNSRLVTTYTVGILTILGGATLAHLLTFCCSITQACTQVFKLGRAII